MINCICVHSSHTRVFLAAKALWRSGFYFLFSDIVNSATFVSNDKVNERMFQRKPALPEYFFSKTGQTGAVWKKHRGRAEWLSAMQIITYLHSVSLLRIRRITIWKWAQKHSGRKACIMILSYIIADTQLLTQVLTHTHTHTHTLCSLLAGCRGIMWELRWGGKFISLPLPTNKS